MEGGRLTSRRWCWPPWPARQLKAVAEAERARYGLATTSGRVRQQHERITLTRNGEAEAVLLSVEDLEGLEMTLEILSDSHAVARITESLAALGRGEEGADGRR
jgi:prevent-host-death family protein